MKLTNNKILEYANSLATIKNSQIKLPVRVNFFLQKNIRTILDAATYIEENRINIGRNYGELNEMQNSYIIPPESMVAANAELNELFSIEQDLEITMIPLSTFDEVELTMEEMDAIMFMVEED